MKSYLDRGHKLSDSLLGPGGVVRLLPVPLVDVLLVLLEVRTDGLIDAHVTGGTSSGRILLWLLCNARTRWLQKRCEVRTAIGLLSTGRILKGDVPKRR
jgi:hypothetical protein